MAPQNPFDSGVSAQGRPAWKAVVAIVLLAVGGPFVIRMIGQGLWWDEAVYLSLARALRAGQYSLEPGAAVESFRPPLFPFLLFMLGGTETVARIFTGLSTAAALVLLARLDRTGTDKVPTTLLFGLCVPGFILCGCKVLTEAPFVILSTAAFLSTRRAEAGHGIRWSALSGLLLGLAFTTRYVGLLTIACCLFALALDRLVRRKGGWHLLATLAGIAVPLVPFALLGAQHYGSPLGMFFENQRIYRSSQPDGFWRGLWGIGITLNLLVPFMVSGLAVLLPRLRSLRPSDLMLVGLAPLSLLLYLLTAHKEPRYLVSFLWVYVPLASAGFVAIHERLGKIRRFLRPGLAGLALIGVVVAAVATAQDAAVGQPLLAGARYLKTITAPGDRVFSVSSPYIYYAAERVPAFTPEEAAIIPFMQTKGIGTALLDKFESGNPPFLNDFFDRHPESFEKLRAFPGRGNPETAVVYRLR